MDSRAGFETARLGMARLRIASAEAREAALQQIARVAARALGVRRVVIRVFQESRRFLRSICAYDAVSDSFVADEPIDVVEVPVFMKAMGERRVLATSDAHAHELTGQLVTRYLGDLVTSMIAAPIFREGALAGIVCLEHVGAPRTWSIADRDFAASVADMVTVLLEQADRMQIEAALRDRREQRLVDDKMAALGRLSRTVAHDLEKVLNALRFIGGELEADNSEKVRKNGAVVTRGVEMASQLLQHLSQFAGISVPTTSLETDLTALIVHMEPVLRRLMGGSELEIVFDTPDATVQMGPAELEQVILNLCINAAEAVAGSGHVLLTLREADQGEPFSPSTVVLEVDDDGNGMDAETQSHLFEPFFSRKAEGRGVGLAAVYGIVTAAGGHILVETQPGEGTAIRVALPRRLDMSGT